MQIKVTKPTRIELPSDVKKIVLVDKTHGNALAVIEGLLSGSFPGLDRTLSQECLSGITKPFLEYSSVAITRHTESFKSSQGTSRSFGNMMPWDQVDRIANENGAEALLVLEYFNSDFSVRDVSSPGPNGVIRYQGYINIRAGIRVYLPASRTLFYENGFTYSNPYGETAANKAQLLGKLAFGSDALKYGSGQLGNRIGRQFVSYQTWEDRQFFKGKSPATKQAERLIIANQYSEAISLLEKEYKIESNSKIKARISHTLGYCYEVNGDLAASKKWLTESFVASGNKKTKRYLDIINRRIQETELLESQQTK
jgi:hypothetical protein